MSSTKPEGWLDWPSHTGAQFICMNGKVWVGNVDIKILGDGTAMLLVWKDGGYFKLFKYSQARERGIQFHNIKWPDEPTPTKDTLVSRRNVLEIIENEPLGYRTQGEHEKLECFTDRIIAKIRNLKDWSKPDE